MLYAGRVNVIVAHLKGARGPRSLTAHARTQHALIDRAPERERAGALRQRAYLSPYLP